jgi:hypothetical protein
MFNKKKGLAALFVMFSVAGFAQTVYDSKLLENG